MSSTFTSHRHQWAWVVMWFFTFLYEILWIKRYINKNKTSLWDMQTHTSKSRHCLDSFLELPYWCWGKGEFNIRDGFYAAFLTEETLQTVSSVYFVLLENSLTLLPCLKHKHRLMFSWRGLNVVKYVSHRFPLLTLIYVVTATVPATDKLTPLHPRLHMVTQRPIWRLSYTCCKVQEPACCSLTF